MRNPFEEIKKNHKRFLLKWVSRTFAGQAIFRIFEKHSAEKIRDILLRLIVDGKSLVRATSCDDYDNKLHTVVLAVRSGVKTNKRQGFGKPSFGQAAKVVNLYVKELVSRPGVIHERDRQRLFKRAHVPLDNIVLDNAWNDFRAQLVRRGLQSKPTLKKLKRREYDIIQQVLRDEARKEGMSPLSYDLVWALRRR